jgi:hypothetical protein
MNLDKTQIGLAGEYFVLAQLTARGYIATLTLGSTKGVHILVTNQEINKLFKVEVKSTTNSSRIEKLFSDKPAFHWTMSKKHEDIKESNLIYCFVLIESADTMPKFYLVPSKAVAEYVKWQHEHWISTRSEIPQETSMRKFRIESDDPNNYLNN